MTEITKEEEKELRQLSLRFTEFGYRWIVEHYKQYKQACIKANVPEQINMYYFEGYLGSVVDGMNDSYGTTPESIWGDAL